VLQLPKSDNAGSHPTSIRMHKGDYIAVLMALTSVSTADHSAPAPERIRNTSGPGGRHAGSRKRTSRPRALLSLANWCAKPAGPGPGLSASQRGRSLRETNDAPALRPGLVGRRPRASTTGTKERIMLQIDVYGYKMRSLRVLLVLDRHVLACTRVVSSFVSTRSHSPHRSPSGSQCGGRR
jgi:hypothetical protein